MTQDSSVAQMQSSAKGVYQFHSLKLGWGEDVDIVKERSILTKQELEKSREKPRT